MSSTTSNPSELDPPPPYEQTASTQTNTDATTPNRDERYFPCSTGLVSHGLNGWPHYKHCPLCTGFWVKKTKDTPFNDLLQISFGLSRYRKDTDEPDCNFTCYLQPRSSTTSKHRIAGLCWNITRLARTHRGSPSEYCECRFKDLRDGVKCEKGGRWYCRLYTWAAAKQVRRWMRWHDEWCRCSCFDTYLTTSGLSL
jgi:hypothetical protein